MKVIIIGAGPAGCALAHGLKKDNFQFTIYDKAPDAYRHRHWAFTLGWGLPYLLKLLPPDLGAQINSCQTDPSLDVTTTGKDHIIIFNGATKEPTYTFPIPRAKELNIRSLRSLCAAQLNVQYNKTFSHYEILPNNSGVRVFFTDGSTDEGTLLIGIDGANSPVRHALLGPEKARMEPLPFALMNFNVTYTAEQALFIKNRIHPLIDIAYHPSGHYMRLNVLDMPDADEPSTWSFQILSTWPLKTVVDYDNEGDRVGRLKQHVKKERWAEPYNSAVEWVGDETEVVRDQLKIWKTVGWEGEGKVTLCGDAAHAMTFHRGQGANNAFYSAHCLVEALKSVHAGTASLRDAVRTYEESLWVRGAHEVQLSKEQTFNTHSGLENFVHGPAMKLGAKPSHDAKVEGYE
ncbi:FAD/NAD(P)-binding domain-containing protein [Plenodomus tracheiphilus IPT5]|uniref:FAD/NAD(P)-binding domain-containing protein n=1 Tax=Plenodomus tracheiphilus IPT5 TaxID=1408161 RepID=A0A6A7BFS2_9PLEO|nr:FAD/NAD(P)-binding domain-containing protein [Plenodomus tracheiphilus IPT5]